jgi:TRAP-type C4-dicarboxylate transport system substrate-binding protein
VKKRILFIMLAVVLALSLSIMGCNGGQQEEEEEEEEPGERQVITLDFATFWPDVDFQFNGDPSLYDGNTGMGHTAWMNAITAEVEARTPNDETGYTIEWNAGSAAPPDLWSGVTAGTYDVITSGPGYTGGIMPLWEGPEYAAELPGRTNAYAMTMTLQALYDEFTPLQDEMEGTGVKVMHFWSTGPGYFLMTEGNDVATLADFAALDDPIRAANPASVLTIEALGAEALKCAMSQALEEFAAGTISGILCPTDTPKGFSLGEYIRSGVYVPSSYQFVFMKVMNPDTWDDLPSVVQDVFDDVNEAWPEYYGKLRTWGEADGLQYCYDEIEGFYLLDLPTEDPTEYAAWTAELEPLIDGWIGTDATRQDLWDKFVEIDAEMAGLYGDWTPGANPPTPPSSF